MAAAIGPDDEAALHITDTLLAGAGLTQPKVARVVCEGGQQAISALVAAGVPFDRDSSGSLLLGREAAHSRDRIVHVRGDEAGAAIMRTLTEAALRSPRITLLESTVAEALLSDEGRITGVSVWDIREGRAVILAADTIVLATGGIGGLYSVTTNPLSSQGHGLSLAAAAGATLRDLEFVQFHPTALAVGRDPAPLATEAIRGAGGVLRNASGERLMEGLHPDGDLAPRDVVARGVAKAIAETGAAYLDVRGALGERFGEAFPTVAAACRDAGLDPSHDLLPIAPAAHYHMGGVRTTEDGSCDVDGLYAVGECASTGLHGANRLASNSLLEAIVMGSRLGRLLEGREARATAPTEEPIALEHSPARALAPVRRAMAQHAGILRDRSGLSQLVAALDRTRAETVGDHHGLRTAGAIAAAALFREESRGAHQRVDHPHTEETPSHTLIRSDGRGGWHAEKEIPAR